MIVIGIYVHVCIYFNLQVPSAMPYACLSISYACRIFILQSSESLKKATVQCVYAKSVPT